MKKEGIRGTTIEAICSEASVSKATFYKYYSNKQGLLEEILTVFSKIEIEWLKELFKGELSIEEKFELVIVRKHDSTEEFGAHFLSELMLSYPLLQPFINRMQLDGLQTFKIILQNERQKGNIDEEISIDLTLQIFNDLTQLFFSQKYIDLEPCLQKRAQLMTQNLLFGLLPRKK